MKELHISQNQKSKGADQRTSIFISHATPDDNEFTAWLSTKLMALGYTVWCDLFNLPKGCVFWDQIETQIRDHSCVFIPVLSTISNRRDGVLKEIAIAEKTQKKLGDDTFICPLRIDQSLSYDDINVSLVRSNIIDFSNSWATRLRELLKFLNQRSTPQNMDNRVVAQKLYQQYMAYSSPQPIDESFESNWFPIKQVKPTIFCYRVVGKMDTMDIAFPYALKKNYFCSFCTFDKIPNEIKDKIDCNKYITLSTNDIIHNSISHDFLHPKQIRNLFIELLNQCIAICLKQKTGLAEYQFSHKPAFYLKPNIVPNNKIKRISLIGKNLDKNWHFAISISIKTYPMLLAQIESHIIFSKDGIIINDDELQHSARRSFGKKWWNDAWYNHLRAFMSFLSDGNDSITFMIGGDLIFSIQVSPCNFTAGISYSEPESAATPIDSTIETEEYNTDHE